MNDILSVDFGQSTYYDWNDPAVTLDEIKAHLIIDFDDDDALLLRYMNAAVGFIQEYCQISINQRLITCAAIVDCYGVLRLPYGPVSYVAGVTNVNNASDWEYMNVGGRLVTTQSVVDVPVVVAYYAGYSGPIPQQLKHGILCQIAYMYENRGDQDKISGLCNEAIMLISSFVQPWI